MYRLCSWKFLHNLSPHQRGDLVATSNLASSAGELGVGVVDVIVAVDVRYDQGEVNWRCRRKKKKTGGEE